MDDEVTKVAEKIIDILRPLPPLNAIRVLAVTALLSGEYDIVRDIMGRIERLERAQKAIELNGVK